MQTLLDLMGRGVRDGTLEFIAPGGRRWMLGHGEPHAAIRLRDGAPLRQILRRPELSFGETYMDGAWDPQGQSLLQVLRVAVQIAREWRRSPLARYLEMARSLVAEFNSPIRSRRNVSHHYVLAPAFYRRFLDADLHYSCAYFREPGMSLEAAQQAKCAHIAAKLNLKRGARVLDIGCGWGSLALYLAQHFDAQVTGITLSQEQLEVARERARERGLERQVEFCLEDYRQTQGEFDAIVSVGMFEHVGRPQYLEFFRHVHELLTKDGAALLHTIGRSTPPGGTNSWIQKYIFPGSYIPAASEVTPALERSGLILCDLEVLRLHYAETLAAWHQRFQAARSDIASEMGERFCRMWEFYLQASEATFRWDDLVVFQVQLARQNARLPLTRDYLYREPARARSVERIHSRPRLVHKG